MLKAYEQMMQITLATKQNLGKKPGTYLETVLTN
jgi:hypothetical protein